MLSVPSDGVNKPMDNWETKSLYRLYVGLPNDANYDGWGHGVLKALAKSNLDGTVYEAWGIWEGQGERSFVVEIDAITCDDEIFDLAQRLGDLYDQVCVLITRQDVRSALKIVKLPPHEAPVPTYDD